MLKKTVCLLALVLLLFPLARAEQLTDSERMTFYDDALFVGDSLARMLRNYIVPLREEDPSFFRDAKFYAAYSYQMRTAARERINADDVNLIYKGSPKTMCEIAAALNPPRLFIWCGLNDRIALHIDWAMSYVDRIMELMARYAPDTQVYFISLPPVTRKVENQSHVQAKWDAYNEALSEKCAQVGAVFIDVATDLKGEDGVMLRGISYDGEYHLNEEGNAIVVQTLLEFAQEQYDLGLWTLNGYAVTE